MKKLLLLATVLASSFTIAQERSFNYERYLVAGQEEGGQLISSYLNPAMKSFMSTSSASWYFTADTHKQWGFDFSIISNNAIVPTSDQAFKFDETKFNNIAKISADNTTNVSELPTIAGSFRAENRIFAEREVNGSTYKSQLITAPNGIGENFRIIPNATLQGSLGVGLGTDVILRFVPYISTNSFTFYEWGIGVKHNISQYIFAKKEKPMHISALIGYTDLQSEFFMDEGKSNSQWKGKNQSTIFETSAWTFQAIASTNFGKNMKFINFYGGIGYNIANSSINMKGIYDVDYTNDKGDIFIDSMENPVSESIKSSGINATVGATLTLAWFNFYADYSYKEYSNFTLGLAFSLN